MRRAHFVKRPPRRDRRRGFRGHRAARLNLLAPNLIAVHAVHLETLQAQLESNGPRTVLDLDEVTLVDVEVVRFLGTCEKEGTALLHCPPYIREWISREQRQ